jgi:hypothetical protein
MKKNIFTSTMYVLGIVGLIITLFIVYKNFDNQFATKFVIGYVIFLILFLFYFVALSIINLRKLKWVDIRKRLYKFVISFVISSCLAFIFYYLKKPSEINFYKILFSPLTISLGLAFSDLPFLRKKIK